MDAAERIRDRQGHRMRRGLREYQQVGEHMNFGIVGRLE